MMFFFKEAQACNPHLLSYLDIKEANPYKYRTLNSILNSLVPGAYGFDFKCLISKCITFMSIFSAIAFQWMAQGSVDDKLTLLPDDTKPLPEPMLTKVHDACGVTKPQFFKDDQEYAYLARQ